MRAYVGQRLPLFPLFPASWQRYARPCITFPQAPLSSRKVGFPESGWQQWHFPREPSRPARGLSVRSRTPLDRTVISLARHTHGINPFGVSCYPSLRTDNFLEYAHHSPRAPSPTQGVTLRSVTSGSHRKALPFPHSYFELMRQSKILSLPRFSLVQRVHAGCRESLLDDGPSRRYLCKSFIACLDPYSGCLCGARARYFPQNIGLPGEATRSALGNTHAMATSAWKILRSCSHSLMFKPAILLAIQVAPTTINILDWAAMAFTSEHITARYLTVPRIC